ncbi:hypothetical protein [Apibacter sp. HY039]|uniref:hypothetical protein n=1 Tax=Apibacter sp. HY039 TaxID=2501476 RepID=UPI000FEB6754|nr:hypothetical protein [Apibacter sp. HY039]
MKKTILLFCILWAVNFASAQEDINITKYQDSRLKEAVPSYALSKVEKLISKLKQSSESLNQDTKNDISKLSDKDFEKLSVKEKFTYTMLYPESVSKNNLNIPAISDEENKIFGYLPDFKSNKKWSDRQISFLTSNKKEVIALIKESCLKDKFIGLNYKKALVKVKAIEAIPFLIDFYKYKDSKDKDILTALSLIVKDGRYFHYIRANIYKDLYGNDDKPVEESYIDDTASNEEYILKTASNFYIQYPKNKM